MFKESAIANIVLSFAPFVVGLVMVMLLGAAVHPKGYAGVALLSYGIGFVFFTAAKIQNVRKGHLLSFGSAKMSRTSRWAYRSGYILMVLGLVVTLALLAASRLNP